MNSLSALGLGVTPGMRPELLARAGEGLASRAVPASELQKLGSQGDIASVTQGGRSSDSFSNLLGDMVQEVNAKQVAAGDAVGGLLTGQNVSLHQAMIAMEEASVSFQLMVEVRNKLLESYQELMRMQI
ncbi:MAG TPA: flagellar hook-basal body complex protein FliE [Clostridia bacterium]|nr:flagellar hook-basal body complex protein FliE [Clostridia bacterium]